MHPFIIYQSLLLQQANGGPGLGLFLIVRSQGGGKDTSYTPCAGLGSWFLFSSGGGYGGSGLSAAQASQHVSHRISLSNTL